MYRIKVTVRAKRNLKEIEKSYQTVIAETINDLRVDPMIGKRLNRELLGRYAYKIGLYRIIYTINIRDKVIIIISAGHRATVYRRTR